MKKWLQEQEAVRVAAMSGSGSTMFAILKDAIGGAGSGKKVKAVFGQTLWTSSATPNHSKRTATAAPHARRARPEKGRPAAQRE